MPEPGRSTHQCDVHSLVRPALREVFGQEGLAGSGAPGAQHSGVRLRHVRHPHLVVGEPSDAPRRVLHLPAQWERRVQIRAQIVTQPSQRTAAGMPRHMVSAAPMVEQLAQPACEILARSRVGHHRRSPLCAPGPPFAVGKDHAVTEGELLHYLPGKVCAQYFPQPVQRRFHLSERTFPGLGGRSASIDVPPDSVAARDPAAFHLDGVESPGTTDEEIDLREALAGVSHRLHRVVDGIAVPAGEGALQPLEYSFFGLTAGVMRSRRNHAHDGFSLSALHEPSPRP